MKLAWKNESTGSWVATSEEVAQYLHYPENHFGAGFMVGRWGGANVEKIFSTLEEAIANAESVSDRTVERGNPSNALSQHLASD